MRFQEVRGCTICCVLQHETCLGRWMGKVCRATVSKRPQSWSDHARIGPTLELTVQVSFSQFRRIQFLKQVSHESFDFTIARCASTKASVSQLQLAVLREVYENFVFRVSTGSFRGKSCTRATRALFSQLQQLSQFLKEVSHESFVLTFSFRFVREVSLVFRTANCTF